jgi:hypothetical protein
MKTLLTAILTFAVLGSAWAQKPTVLTNAQLKALLSKGVTVKVTGADRANTAARTSTAVYQQDGTARLNEGSNTNTVIGSWKIDGNKFCTKYTSLGSGCFNLQTT